MNNTKLFTTCPLHAKHEAVEFTKGSVDYLLNNMVAMAAADTYKNLDFDYGMITDAAKAVAVCFREYRPLVKLSSEDRTTRPFRVLTPANKGSKEASGYAKQFPAEHTFMYVQCAFFIYSLLRRSYMGSTLIEALNRPQTYIDTNSRQVEEAPSLAQVFGCNIRNVADKLADFEKVINQAYVLVGADLLETSQALVDCFVDSFSKPTEAYTLMMTEAQCIVNMAAIALGPLINLFAQGGSGSASGIVGRASHVTNARRITISNWLTRETAYSTLVNLFCAKMRKSYSSLDKILVAPELSDMIQLDKRSGYAAFKENFLEEYLIKVCTNVLTLTTDIQWRLRTFGRTLANMALYSEYMAHAFARGEKESLSEDERLILSVFLARDKKSVIDNVKRSEFCERLKDIDHQIDMKAVSEIVGLIKENYTDERDYFEAFHIDIALNHNDCIIYNIEEHDRTFFPKLVHRFIRKGLSAATSKNATRQLVTDSIMPFNGTTNKHLRRTVDCNDMFRPATYVVPGTSFELQIPRIVPSKIINQSLSAELAAAAGKPEVEDRGVKRRYNSKYGYISYVNYEDLYKYVKASCTFFVATFDPVAQVSVVEARVEASTLRPPHSGKQYPFFGSVSSSGDKFVSDTGRHDFQVCPVKAFKTPELCVDSEKGESESILPLDIHELLLTFRTSTLASLTDQQLEELYVKRITSLLKGGGGVHMRHKILLDTDILTSKFSQSLAYHALSFFSDMLKMEDGKGAEVDNICLPSTIFTNNLTNKGSILPRKIRLANTYDFTFRFPAALFADFYGGLVEKSNFNIQGPLCFDGKTAVSVNKEPGDVMKITVHLTPEEIEFVGPLFRTEKIGEGAKSTFEYATLLSYDKAEFNAYNSEYEFSVTDANGVLPRYACFLSPDLISILEESNSVFEVYVKCMKQALTSVYILGKLSDHFDPAVVRKLVSERAAAEVCEAFIAYLSKFFPSDFDLTQFGIVSQTTSKLIERLRSLYDSTKVGSAKYTDTGLFAGKYDEICDFLKTVDYTDLSAVQSFTLIPPCSCSKAMSYMCQHLLDGDAEYSRVPTAISGLRIYGLSQMVPPNIAEIITTLTLQYISRIGEIIDDESGED